MKRVTMKTTAAGPNGVYVAGTTYNMEDAVAKGFLEAGAAVLVETVKAGAAVETAVVEPKETAVSRRGKK